MINDNEDQTMNDHPNICKTIQRDVTATQAHEVNAARTQANAIENAQQVWRELAFRQVQNPDDWKAPIDVIVPTNVARLYSDAIVHFTATGVHRTPSEDGSCIRLRSIGYRMGPAGP